MKLFVSALLLAAATVAGAQNQGVIRTVQVSPSGSLSPQDQAALAKTQAQAQAQMQAMADRMSQAGCPLLLESASVASPGNYLPITARDRQDAMLDLHFRNQSGKAIASVSVTARVNVKTNVYALDAHSLQLRMNFGGTRNVDRDEPQQIETGLPHHAYLFGVAQVTLDQVTYADGSVWSAPAGSNVCRTSGGFTEQIAK
ncbi:MAG TPA: hypothetical protein VHX60_18405 [Acidobacteriaceae bacterium]|jgi:hypothetical protein|nr:hypothetical protein [Acidobacteriaceae bacterium]